MGFSLSELVVATVCRGWYVRFGAGAIIPLVACPLISAVVIYSDQIGSTKKRGR